MEPNFDILFIFEENLFESNKVCQFLTYLKM